MEPAQTSATVTEEPGPAVENKWTRCELPKSTHKSAPPSRTNSVTEIDGGGPRQSGAGLRSVQDFPDFELPDLMIPLEPGGAQNKTLFYLTSSSLNVALLASDVADIMRWVQKKGTAKELGLEIVVLLSIMVVIQLGMLGCFCGKMYNSSALQTILDRTKTPEERAEKEAGFLKSLEFGNKLTVILIALALVTSVLQVSYKILTS
ncbi:hypothetical protein BV898_02466 [Hypsibius exemplaris]|uniref:Uncharacterized protein n=1 Tax=Hypsibius exemplaris TaxID=2072580 RepID=A0A1W0X877_HYPEX|nr:hypothetical protein BV898_02466 [Hypsibius exemplaris]